MIRILLNIMIALLAVLATSCFKDDELVARHIPGSYTSDTIELTPYYTNQVYYSLNNSNKVVINNKDSWDLGFESAADGWRVILNSSCFMKSTFLDGQHFGSPADTTGAKWLYNPSDGSADSLAIGKWFSDEINGVKKGTNRLLLLDRGMDFNGDLRGFNQLIVDSLVNTTYYFRIADMDGANPKSFSVTKKLNVNYRLFSISTPTAVISEPSNADWDILFTQYTTLLYTSTGLPYPYLVTGVLLNPNIVEVALDSITPFENLTFEQAKSMVFTIQADKIGWEWKIYDFDKNTYKINPKLVYVIRDTKGFLYKFHFTNFYRFQNKRLDKGYPSFEYQKL